MSWTGFSFFKSNLCLTSHQDRGHIRATTISECSALCITEPCRLTDEIKLFVRIVNIGHKFAVFVEEQNTIHTIRIKVRMQVSEPAMESPLTQF